jgi:hypothetical protein
MPAGQYWRSVSRSARHPPWPTTPPWPPARRPGPTAACSSTRALARTWRWATATWRAQTPGTARWVRPGRWADRCCRCAASLWPCGNGWSGCLAVLPGSQSLSRQQGRRPQPAAAGWLMTSRARSRSHLLPQIEQYNFGAPGYAFQTGHFSQMIWRDTQRIGCGVAPRCSGGNFLVCHYDPPGERAACSAAGCCPPVACLLDGGRHASCHAVLCLMNGPPAAATPIYPLLPQATSSASSTAPWCRRCRLNGCKLGRCVTPWVRAAGLSS